VTDPFRDRLAAALAATYRIDDELLGGGMSRVFAATEHALGRRVVIKVLPPELSAGVNRERFQREIQVAAQLQHPHIVPLLSAGRIGAANGAAVDTMATRSSDAASESELLYYTMPFIEGESLRAAIARRGRLPVREVVRIMHDVVEALAYAHGRGVVHRDIKPGNILTIGSHALVTDFGVAKALSAAMPVSGMTSAGMAIGTPAYMAPEQLAADPAADHRIDIYAVGLLAYELLSGQSPFLGTSPQQTLAAQLTRVPESLDTLRDDVPPALAAVIMRCLEKLPEHRPQSADALLDELDAAVTPSGGTGATGPVTSKVETGRSSSSRIQRRALIAGGLLVLMAGVAVALGTWRRATGGAGSGAGSGAGGASSAATVATAPGAASSAAPAAAAAPGVTGGAGNATAVTPARPLGDSAPRAPVVLTRAESLAIADAVRKRVTAREDSQVAKGAQRPSDVFSAQLAKALNDSLVRMIAGMREGRRVDVRGFDPKEIEKLRELARAGAAMPNVVVDPRQPPGVRDAPSVGRTIPPPSAPSPFPPPAPGVRRVVLGAARMSNTRRETAAIGIAILDSLRRAIAARPGYEVVDAAALGNLRVAGSRSRTALARAAGAGAMVNGLYYPRADSLVVLQLQLIDLQRNRVVQVLESKPIDMREPMRDLGELASAVLGALDGVDWRPPPTANKQEGLRD
jgi:eukaryotic-like serine/threonine-protein kinase